MGRRTVVLPEWGEAVEETGRGTITAVEGAPDARNVKVVIRADHLREPVHGWLDRQAVALDPVPEMRVNYRVVVHRHTDGDRAVALDVPIAEVPARGKIRDLLELTVVEVGKGPTEEDKAASTAHEGDAGRRQAEANRAAAARQRDEPATSTESPPEPSAAPQTANERPPAGNGDRRAEPGPRVAEGKNWELYNSDGSVNVGSYAVQAGTGMVELAEELLRLRQPEEGDPPGPVDRKRRNVLAGHLMRCADAVQAAVRADGHANRLDASHARARGAIRSALRIYPPPWTSTDHARDLPIWREHLIGYATELLVDGVELGHRAQP